MEARLLRQQALSQTRRALAFAPAAAARENAALFDHYLEGLLMRTAPHRKDARHAAGRR